MLPPMKSRPLALAVALAAQVFATTGRAEPGADHPPHLGPELQADLGLAVIGLGYEQPCGEHLAIMGEVQTTSTYFAPWFSAGDTVMGFGGQVRATWFSRTRGRGLYITPWLRVDRVTGTRDGADGHAVGIATGLYVGWAFRLQHLDVRLGAGPMYMRYDVPTSNGRTGVDTPFFSLDAVVGYRL